MRRAYCLEIANSCDERKDKEVSAPGCTSDMLSWFRKSIFDSTDASTCRYRTGRDDPVTSEDGEGDSLLKDPIVQDMSRFEAS